MNNIIKLHNVNELKFITKIAKKTINENKNNENIKRQVVICLKNTKTNKCSKTLPISIVTNTWINNKTSTIRNNTNKFVRLLNYIYFESPHKISNFFELTPELLLEFFKYISKTSGKDYVVDTENKITKALKYFCDNEMMKNFSLKDFYINKESGNIYLQCIHSKYAIPKKRKLNKLHDLPLEIAFELIELAMTHTPEIALGIYFQIFGGLRASEVLSLEYSNINNKISENTNIIHVNLVDKDLRPDLSSGFEKQVKKNRKQMVFVVNGLYDKLIELNKTLTSNSKTNALFLDANGNPMTYSTYSRKFKNLKKLLTNQLNNSEDLDTKLLAITIENHSWGTHICRGIYSNLIAENANTSYELAHYRGDSNFTSSLPYLSDTKKVEDSVTTILGELYGQKDGFYN